MRRYATVGRPREEGVPLWRRASRGGLSLHQALARVPDYSAVPRLLQFLGAFERQSGSHANFYIQTSEHLVSIICRDRAFICYICAKIAHMGILNIIPAGDVPAIARDHETVV